MSTRFLIPILLLGFAACARKAPAGGEPGPDSPPAQDLSNAEVTIVIVNHHLLDITVYLMRGGNLQRLGTAPGLSTKIFSVPWRRVEGRGEIRLAADPIGQNATIRTEYLVVRPGSVVEWAIESVLTQSSVSVH
ncbi:MAG: hypothetical protein ABI679_06895 [Gemmatimonadota bacterium]